MGVGVGGDAEAHKLASGEEYPLVIGSHPIEIVVGGVDRRPESAVHDLIKHRRQRIDAVVVEEVGGADEVAGPADGGDGVAEFS